MLSLSLSSDMRISRFVGQFCCGERIVIEQHSLCRFLAHVTSQHTQSVEFNIILFCRRSNYQSNCFMRILLRLLFCFFFLPKFVFYLADSGPTGTETRYYTKNSSAARQIEREILCNNFAPPEMCACFGESTRYDHQQRRPHQRKMLCTRRALCK